MRLIPAALCLALAACKAQPASQNAAGATPDAGASAAGPSALGPIPETPKLPVTDTLHGVAIVDEYRWLEDSADPKVKAWNDAESARARAYLDTLPSRELIERRIGDLYSRRPPSIGGLVWRPKRSFAIESDPARKQQPALVVLDSLEIAGKRRTLLDLMVLDPTGATSIDWFVPSVDGSKLAVVLSKGGSEDGSVHVYDVATGKETGDVIPRVQEGTGGGSLSWNADSTGFYYTRYPRAGERPKEELDFWQQAYFHKLGTPESKDTHSMGKGLPRIAEIELQSSEDGRHQLAMVQNGDGSDFALWLLPAGGKWVEVAGFDDGVIAAGFGRDEALWLLSKKDAPRRRVLRLPLKTPQLAKAKVVIDQRAGVIEQIMPTQSRLYLVELLGGPTRVIAFDLQGQELPKQLELPEVTTNAALRRLDGDDVFFLSTGYLEPLTGYRYRAATHSLQATVVRGAATESFQDSKVTVEHAVSKDGTKVPMFILERKDTVRDGKNPTLLTGYGGFGISTEPFYSDLKRVYLDQGVVLVYSALRGGGEFGEAWHAAGKLTNKQHVFDDFIACAQRLIELGYTAPEHLAIEGASNGGLLVGAALTQRPDLFRAVVARVGIYDLLRNELSSNGQFNVTELGSVKDPEQFKALRAYSPLHNLKEGVDYPPVLFMTGANDPRVDPMQSRKMVARMQAVSPDASKRPVLLRSSDKTGHGMGSPIKEVISGQVDAHAFVLHELGVQVKPKQPLPGG